MKNPRWKATYKGAVIGWYGTATEAEAALEAAEGGEGRRRLIELGQAFGKTPKKPKARKRA